MSGLAEDHDAAIMLIIGEYRKLKGYNPKHELLQYLKGVSDDGLDFAKEREQQFLDRFETPEDKKSDRIKVAKVLTAYYVALRKANDELGGVDRSPKPRFNHPSPHMLDLENSVNSTCIGRGEKVPF